MVIGDWEGAGDREGKGLETGDWGSGKDVTEDKGAGDRGLVTGD